MTPKIDHIEITVADLDRAERFYDVLLPLLGFDLKDKGRGEFPAYEHVEIDYGTADFSPGRGWPRCWRRFRLRPSSPAAVRRK